MGASVQDTAGFVVDVCPAICLCTYYTSRHSPCCASPRLAHLQREAASRRSGIDPSSSPIGAPGGTALRVRSRTASTRTDPPRRGLLPCDFYPKLPQKDGEAKTWLNSMI